MTKRYYPTLQEASLAARALGIKSRDEYLQRYTEDPRLPSKPWTRYPGAFDQYSFFNLPRPVARYETYLDASNAAQALGIKNHEEYRARFREDPMLHSSPHLLFKDQWQGYLHFLGQAREHERYSTLEEAKKAVQKLNIKSVTEYRQRYREDPRLPSSPAYCYRDEWAGYPVFLRGVVEKYPTLAQTRAAVEVLGVYSPAQYRDLYHLDPRLPSHPDEFYKGEWQGFAYLLKGDLYHSQYDRIAEASEAAVRLGITSESEYAKLRTQDARLPVAPGLRYQSQWISWDHFLTDPSAYASDSSNLADSTTPEKKQKLKADELGSFRRSRHSHSATSWDSWGDSAAPDSLNTAAPESEDPVTPDEVTQAADSNSANTQNLAPTPSTSPESQVSQVDEANPESQTNPAAQGTSFYPDLASAARAVQAMGIKNRRDYAARRGEDPRLPSSPEEYYRSAWSGWKTFFGKASSSKFYPTLAEATKAARRLNADSVNDYKVKARLDPLLPLDPQRAYADDWVSWPAFLGIQNGRREPYATLEEVRVAALALGITSGKEYESRFREDPRLRSSPHKYFDNFPGYEAFLGKTVKSFYETLEEFQAAVRRLGITTHKDFKARYKEDPRIHSNPNKVYKGWTSWPAILAGEKVEFYPTVAEASEAAQRLGFRTKKDYLLGYKADPQLPSSPHVTYKREWVDWDWDTYLGAYRGGKYPTYAEAAIAAQRLCIIDANDYSTRYTDDPQLPSAPAIFYKDSWEGLQAFLLPVKCRTLADVKQYIRVLRISNSVEYRAQYKNYPALPANPHKVFEDEWVDWYDLCDMPQPYSYDELVEIMQSEGIQGANAYQRFRSKSGDPRIPSEPQIVYVGKWVNWHVFLGKPEPYGTQNIRMPYLEWARQINIFGDKVKGGSGKVAAVCKFVRHHVQRLELSDRPEVFFANNELARSEFVTLMEAQGERGGQGSFLKAMTEFADHIIKEKLTAVDPETGEVVVAFGISNPFLNFGPTSELGSSRYGETSKPALTYSFVRGLREWIIPKTANNFSELEHLHVFEADWFEIDPANIDPTDPDCVYRMENGRAKIWTPMNWLHSYALASVPARGRQLGYNDSGEADAEIPQYVDGKIVWVKNTSPLAGKQKKQKQGFVKHYREGFGMHFTSNKSSIAHSGYSVAWMPLELAKWVIRLRDWQQKYNPINRPTPWTECRRTELNSKQLEAKGTNCFLFREFGGVEVAEFSSKLSPRLACALYHSQPKGMELATHSGNPAAITTYSSEYTPHTMRVSLITAFIVEFGLSVEIVMKLAGHSSIVMSIYYVKINSGQLRERFDEHEKIALQNEVKATMHMIEQKRLDEIRHRLIANFEEGPGAYTERCAPGSVLVRDQGFCPMAGARCHDGGALIGKTKVRAAVVSGYMGAQNCIRCRHFVSGPAFLGGLLSTANEISLATNFQSEHYAELEDSIAQTREAIDDLLVAEYQAEKCGETFDASALPGLNVALEKTKSEAERVAMKLAELLTDLQYVTRLIKHCHVILQSQASTDATSGDMQLILQPGHEVQLVLTETSRFHLLNEVCENAQIYESASAVIALPSRSQFLDKMLSFNKIWPVMSMLTSSQQLSVGNQMSKFLYHRLKTHERVDQVMDGIVKLQDLSPDEQIRRVDLEQFFKPLGLRLEEGGQPERAEVIQELLPVLELEDYD